MKEKTILIVDDDQEFLEEISQVLKDEHFRIVTSISCVETINIIKKIKPDVILLDKKLQMVILKNK